MHDGGSKLAATKDSSNPPKEVYQIVQDYLAAELDRSADATLTDLKHESKVGYGNQFALQGGEQYRLILLGHNTKRGYGITGVAVMLLDQENEFRYPADIIEIVSRFMEESGSVDTFVTVY
jgi:hypothetical protein